MTLSYDGDTRFLLIFYIPFKSFLFTFHSPENIHNFCVAALREFCSPYCTSSTLAVRSSPYIWALSQSIKKNHLIDLYCFCICICAAWITAAVPMCKLGKTLTLTTTLFNALRETFFCFSFVSHLPPFDSLVTMSLPPVVTNRLFSSVGRALPW